MQPKIKYRQIIYVAIIFVLINIFGYNIVRRVSHANWQPRTEPKIMGQRASAHCLASLRAEHTSPSFSSVEGGE